LNIDFNLNGVNVCYNVPSDLRVIDLLREHLNLTGTKESCGSGECGSCTILINGESKLACLMLASQLKGKEVVTIEGIGKEEKLHPIQEEFIKKGAVQCGFCTPGMIISAIDLLKRKKILSREEIRKGISGNICRCTGYQKIVDAIEAASEKSAKIDKFEKMDYTPLLINKDRFNEKAKVFLPLTLDELWNIMEKYPDAILYSGGTDILTKRRKQIIPYEKNLICIEKIQELKIVKEREDKIFIGAGSTFVSLTENHLIEKNFPVLMQALNVIGSPQIRHMGTIGGNICTASPAGDTLPPLYVLEAVLEIRSKSHKREVSIKDFILGSGKTDLEHGEIIYGIKIKKKPEYNFQYYEKVGQRNALSISIAGIAIIANISSKKIIEQIKIAWGSVAPTVVVSEKIENKLIGQKLSEKVIKSVFPLIDDTVSPIDDIRASVTYRLALSKNLLLRLEQLWL